MNVDARAEVKIAAIAAAIGEPARTRMLYCLMDGRARTSTELAVVADVSQSTASEHLRKLSNANLVRVVAQGKHRYYSLQGVGIAGVLEKLSVLGEGAGTSFVPKTPERLRSARTCYDHLAGTVGVTLHDHFCAQGWLAPVPRATDNAYQLTARGTAAFEALGIDVERARSQRRRLAFGCLDWSERRFHVGGSIGAAFYAMALKKKWVKQDLDSRAVALTNAGRREMSARFGVQV
jgi:DNA-binding transcriptional ArsR family regulator